MSDIMDDLNQEIKEFNVVMAELSVKKINEFNTFDDFYDWLQADVTDVKGGKSEELKLKTYIRRSSIDIIRRRVPGESLEVRNKAMEKVGYKQGLRWVYEEIHN